MKWVLVGMEIIGLKFLQRNNYHEMLRLLSISNNTISLNVY